MRRLVLALTVAALCDCSRSRIGPAPEASASASLSPALRDAALPPATASATLPPPAPCAPASGYRGEVLGVPVLARLGLDGARLHGRYLYERIGKDIALEGTAQPSGAVHLVEGALKSPTGTFDGACDASGSITGT